MFNPMELARKILTVAGDMGGELIDNTARTNNRLAFGHRAAAKKVSRPKSRELAGYSVYGNYKPGVFDYGSTPLPRLRGRADVQSARVVPRSQPVRTVGEDGPPLQGTRPAPVRRIHEDEFPPQLQGPPMIGRPPLQLQDNTIDRLIMTLRYLYGR